MSGISVHSGFTALKLKLITYRSVFVVYDRNVEEYAQKVASGKPSMAITADEEHKNIDTVMGICAWLLSQGADRDALVMAIGGGVTTDMVGFAASIYKRGVRYANVPTTLLSMIDAGIGGKTGVNFKDLKNMLGVIRQPEFTYIATDTLKTLPRRELLSGAAEMLKTFIIDNRHHSYEKAITLLSSECEPGELADIIETAASIKEKVVKKDEFETGLRRVLNLGHTYGHAIEWWQRSHDVADPYTHGEAVAIGMIRAAELSEELGIAKPGLAAKLRADFNYCGLPVEMPCATEELESAVRQDKKAEGGKINFILIKEIGKVVIKKI